ILNITDGSLLFGVDVDEGRVFQVAQEAVTLLSPSKAEFISRVPRGPSPLDRIVIFTDSRTYSRCSVCKDQINPPVRALENSIERLYGFGGISQNSTLELFSFSFVDLYQYVTGVNVESDKSSTENSGGDDGGDISIRVQKNIEINNALLGSDWLVFAVGDVQDDIENNALKLLLTERPDLLADRKVIVFAMGAPYYLDATDVSQTTAYYGLYGKSSPFIEVAARVLFQEIVPHESPPVSVDSVSYDLHANLAPYPGQSFLVTPIQDIGESDTSDNTMVNNVSGESGELSGGVATPIPSLTEIIQGSTVNLQTSMLLDHNSKNVPDGTIVEFDASYLAEGGITETFAVSKTVSGVAIGTLVVDRMGLVEIRARSGDAISEPLKFDVLMATNELDELDEEKFESEAAVSIIETAIPIEATSTVDIVTGISAVSTTIPETNTQVITVIDGSEEVPESVHIDPRDLMSAILAMIVI
ncbi:MAG: hypothetical protein VX237_03520, partial [Chloroflexota bacterium]|nr:hypothetical protein [Chloroflexota bacterium]